MSLASITSPAMYSRMPNWQKVLIALAASILINLAIILCIGFWWLLHLEMQAKPLDKLKIVEVSVATPTPAPSEILPLAQPQPTPTPFIDTSDLHKTDQAPKNAVFESAENSAAGSKLPPSGNVPLPSQDGTNREQVAFSTHRYTLGSGEGGVPAPPVMEFAPAPEPQQSHPEPTPAPAPPETAPPAATPAPTPMPTPEATPKFTSATPLPEPTAPEAFFNPTPVPAATVAPTPDMIRPTPVPTPATQSIATLPKPRPSPPAEPVRPQQPAYLPETQQNILHGSLSNSTQPGVDAVGTPKGRYEKRLSAAIGSLWYYYVHQRMDLINSGTVHIKFFVNEKGEVEEPKIISNTSNEALASCSMEAILKAKLAPPPPDVAASLENGRYKTEFSFTINPYQ